MHVQKNDIPPHPDNIFPNGKYDPMMYELVLERDPVRPGVFRVLRGARKNHIGNVVRLRSHRWTTERTSPGKSRGLIWESRALASYMLSHEVPLTLADGDPFPIS